MIINKYYDEYNNIITFSKQDNRRKLERTHPQYVYYENHHIIPRSLGGEDEDDNLVLLTPEEHYKCHELLPQFTEGSERSKMLHAWWRMSCCTKGIKIDAKLYGELKRSYTDTISKERRGANHHSFGKPLSQRTKDRISKAKKGKSLTKEHREQLSKVRKGRVNTPDSNKKRSDTMKGRKHELVECPYCNKIGGQHGMKRWHFDNCKHYNKSDLDM